MYRSDEHLESALREYNQKVSELEDRGASEELLEALVNRSSILLMMESYTSALEDCEDALYMLNSVVDVEVGTFMKLHENHAIIVYDNDLESALDDYSAMSERLDELQGQDVRHYERRTQIEMCLDCTADLLDASKEDLGLLFADKCRSLIADDLDRWSRNRRFELAALLGSYFNGEKALPYLDEAILLGSQLYDAKQIEDPMDLVLSYVARGDIMEHDSPESMWEDHEKAAAILEEMYFIGRLDNTSLLVDIHQGIASSMMESGMIEKAEKHLVRAINLGIPGMREAMERLIDDN